VFLIIPFAAFLCGPSAALAGSILSSATSFAVLGGQSVTNTGITTIVGDLGVSPGSSYTGGGTVTQTGTVYLANGVSQQAEADVTTAYDYLAGLGVNQVLTGQDLGGKTLDPGVYFFSSSAPLTGTLTLDAQNNPNAFFDFEIGSTLITASDAVVNVINATSGTGVFWQVGSSATLGTGTTFAGNILALASITLDTGASITCGRALAQTGSVTLDANAISDNCSANALGSGRTDAGSVGFSSSTTPEPGTVPLLGTCLFALTLYGWRLKKRVA
jgi:type VI secretion system secreted protein VgrG